MKSAKYAEIPLDTVDDPERPLRGNIDDTHLEELMQSMATHGLIQPIRIQPNDKRYRVIVGHRRTEAARRLHWATIPAIIHATSEDLLPEVQLHENLHRENLSPSEESRVIQGLAGRDGWTLTRIASAMGKSVPWVQERLEMIEWPDGLMSLVDQKAVSIGVARILMRIPNDNALQYLANQAAHAGATIAQAQAWYTSYMSKPWQLPTPEEIQAAKEAMKPPPIPKAYCQGCEIELDINQLTSIMACPGCVHLLPALKKTSPRPLQGHWVVGEGDENVETRKNQADTP